MPSYVLDTSAILSALLQEDGADEVRRILNSARDEEPVLVLVPFIALMETEYQLLRRLNLLEAQETLLLVEEWPIQIEESNSQWRHEAARVKAAGRLSLADAWVASLAILRDSELVHKDPEFDRVQGLRALRLPYKRPQS
jgi:predicted nucleic acid-binding protein